MASPTDGLMRDPHRDIPGLGTSAASDALVLNIDRDAVNRNDKTRLLVTAGLDVIEAEDVSTALALSERRRPSLALLEIENADGREAGSRIRTAWPGIVVIQISALSSLDAVPADDADCCLSAPVKAADLLAVARAMLRLGHAESRAFDAEQRSRSVIDGALDQAIFVCSPDGRIAEWSAGAEAVLGFTAAEMIGQPRARLFEADDVVAGDGNSAMVARWHRRRDGTFSWCSGRVVALRDRHGAAMGTLWVLTDHSAEQQARETISTLNREFEDRVAERTRDLGEANKRLRLEMHEREQAATQFHQLQKMQALAQLTGGIAHDFNNLLTAIMGGLEVTRRRIQDDRSLRLIDGSLNAAKRGAKLISQLMAFARRQILEAEHLDLNALLTEVTELLERSVGPSVRVIYELRPDCWTALADASQLRTALLNLVVNARDAMPDGGVLRITTGNTWIEEVATDSDLTPGGYVMLRVQDNGTGMSDAVRARVFEPFFTTKEVGKGTGLGLAQVHGFVRQSGGDVQVDSVPGSGTTITILLPRATLAEDGLDE